VDGTNQARKRFAYIPLIDRLRIQYQNPARSKILGSYRQSLSQPPQEGQGKLCDFFDGELFRSFHVGELGLFNDPRDVALHMSLDGVQITNMKHHEVTPIIFINLNLPPEERYQVKNILAGLLIPGPKKPMDLDTFLQPLVDELLELDKGVPAFDGYTGARFLLRAWVTMVTGDGPALSDAIGMKRPGNALRPCRTCKIKAKRGQRVYYVPHTDYDFINPPIRTGLRELIELVEQADSEHYRKLTGITRSSLLLKLRSLHFPRSFPADIMHLVLQNIAPSLYKLWSGTKLAIDDRKKPNFRPQPYHLKEDDIAAISSALADARADIPTYLSHAPRRIDNHHKGYKAAEWEAWVKLFGVPLLDQRLDDMCVENFRLLSQIYSLCTQYSLRHTDVVVLEDLAMQFVQTYERLYYRNEFLRMPVCSVNIHYLLHFPLYIRDCGPARYWWQFPMERFCGVIKPMARSKSQLNVSLANALITTEHLNHLQFLQEQPQAVEPNSYPQLLSSYRARLTSYQREFLTRRYNCHNFDQVAFYKRCQLRDDLIVGSIESQRRSDITRRNYRVCYMRPQSNQMEFGAVQHFVSIPSQGRHLGDVAWIRGLEDVDIDCKKLIASYGRQGSHFWIEIGWIKSLFGVIEEGGVKFIVTNVNLFD
jgi:hypothetical protein